MPEELTNQGQTPEVKSSLDRTQVIDAFILARTAEGNRSIVSAEASFAISNEMDGKMQSRYDNQREEHAAEGLMKQIAGEKSLGLVAEYVVQAQSGETTPTPGIVSENSIVLLRDTINMTNEWFFFSRLGGGLKVNVGMVEIRGVNPETPLGIAAMGKKVRGKVEYEVGEGDFLHMEHFKVLEII